MCKSNTFVTGLIRKTDMEGQGGRNVWMNFFFERQRVGWNIYFSSDSGWAIRAFFVY